MLYWNGSIMSKAAGKLGQSSLQTKLPHKLVRRDKECNLHRYKRDLSQLSVNAPCVFLQFFVTQDYYSCVSITNALVLQYYLIQ